MKSILIPLVLLFSVASFAAPHRPAETQTSNDVVIIRYNESINGYNVTIRWRPDSLMKSCWGDAVYILENKKDTVIFKHRVCIDDIGVIPDYEHCLGKTIILEYKTPKSNAPFPGNVLVNFADVNYDGEKELISYDYLSTLDHLGERGNQLDCYAIYVWKIKGSGVQALAAKPFEELAKGLCRTQVYFDKKNQALILDTYLEYGHSHQFIYYFETGHLIRVTDQIR